MEQIRPYLPQTEDDFDERWADDEECEERPKVSGLERWNQLQLERAERKAQGFGFFADDEDEDDDEEGEEDTFVGELSEEEDAEVEKFFQMQHDAYQKEWQRKFVEEPRRKWQSSGAKLQSRRTDREDGASEAPRPSEQQGGLGTPSLRKRAKKEGFVLVPAAFRQICDNGD